MPASDVLANAFRYLVYASVGLTFLQIYLTLNKLWKRKHERAVAESVSILGEFVGLMPLMIMTVHFGLQSQWEGFIDGLMWIFGASVTVMIGTGIWVEGQRRQGLLSLLWSSIRSERKEVGYLAKSFLQPSGAEQIMDILGHVALLDSHLDDREREFIGSFGDAWGIDVDWAALESRSSKGTDPLQLREGIARYLATSPPLAQVVQLGDVLVALVAIDDEVTAEESLMMAEVNGMLSAYAGSEEPRWGVVLVPQGPAQDSAVRSLLPNLKPTEIRGGKAYLVGRHHSREYAEVVGARYAELNVFSAVIRLDRVA